MAQAHADAEKILCPSQQSVAHLWIRNALYIDVGRRCHPRRLAAGRGLCFPAFVMLALLFIFLVPHGHR